MGFLHRLGNAMARFMYGRNGMDQLNRALFWIYLILWLARTFLLGILQSKILLGAMDAVSWLIAVTIFFRMFSKNLYKRRAENQKFLSKTVGIRSKLAGAKQRHADKDHKYFTCNTCKTICRVPVGKGTVIITCPKCGAQIKGKT